MTKGEIDLMVGAKSSQTYAQEKCLGMPAEYEFITDNDVFDNREYQFEKAFSIGVEIW